MPNQVPGAMARVVHFGTFELSLDTGELRKHGVRIRLQAQPFQVLKALLEQPGEIVTREELRGRLWPGDAFGDFENGLNTAINRLRLALGDSAEEPRYVETLARIGYRFVAPIREVPAKHQATIHHEARQVSGAVPIQVSGRPAFESIDNPGTTSERSFRRRHVILSGVGIGALTFIGYLAWLAFASQTASPVYHQITFHPDVVHNARFAPSGEVVYDAGWKDNRFHLYLTDIISPESRDLGLGPARLVAVSRSAELAILDGGDQTHLKVARELAIVPLHGGAPRMLAAEVEGADWASDGKTLCIIHWTDRGASIEFPPGRTLYRSSGSLDNSRISPRGDRIAFVEHPVQRDDGGNVMMVDLAGKSRRLTEGWASIQGLAWNPAGNEIWFAAARKGLNRDIHAVSLDGHVRTVASLASELALFDIAPSGHVLFARETSRLNMFVGSIARLTPPKDISWFDWSHATGISANGNEILFDESGEGGGPNYSIYLHHRDRATTERIGEGRALDLSRDGRWVLAGSRTVLSEITLISTADSIRRTLTAAGLAYQNARFLPNGQDILVRASKQDGPTELYIQNLSTGAVRSVPNSVGIRELAPSPDGTTVAGLLRPAQLAVLRIDTGERKLMNVTPGSFPVGWANDHAVITAVSEDHSVHLQTVDMDTGQISTFRHLPIEITTPGKDIMCLVLSADLSTYAYSQKQISTNLFTADGWR